MKKILVFILVVALCLAGLWGCAGGKKEYSARVEGLTEDGIIVRIPDSDLGYVYVKHVNADLQIGSLDTVYMEFEESDLKAESGTFVDVFRPIPISWKTPKAFAWLLRENPHSVDEFK